MSIFEFKSGYFTQPVKASYHKAIRNQNEYDEINKWCYENLNDDEYSLYLKMDWVLIDFYELTSNYVLFKLRWL